MTELERLLTEQLTRLAAAHEQQLRQLSEQFQVHVQAQEQRVRQLSEQFQVHVQALDLLSQRVEALTELLES